MKSLSYYITEKRHVGADIIHLANYTYDLLEKLVNTTSNNPTYKTHAYELYKESGVDEYDIEVNFKDIPNFNWMNYQLIPGNLLPDFEYDCDFVVQLADIDAFGTMQTNEPILQIGARFLRTPNIFKKNEAQIRNTLMHEFTHYVQYMGGLFKGGTNPKNAPDYDIEFYNNLNNFVNDNKTTDNKYYTMSFIIYAFTDNERYARVSGFYGTVITEYNKLLKEYSKECKKNKIEVNKTGFTDFVVNNEKYNDTETHINLYETFLKDIENDTYENYKACIEDPTTIFRDDSMVYVYLNMCDHLTPKPSYLLPSHNICVYNTRTEAEYDNIKNKIINKFSKNYKQYKHNLSVVVSDIWDEMNNI